MKAKTLRCAVYTRKSTEEGLEQDFNSLHAQRQAGEAYVLSQTGEGWVALPEQYDDGGFSGGTMDRPALKRLLDDVDRGLIDVVVVYKVDRLTRALNDFAKIVERFDARGVSFVSVTQAFNTTSSMGRLTLNVLLSFAQFEREVTGERIRDKIAASKAKGMWMGGVPPLGYAPNGRTLAIVESEAETVRHVFRRYLELGSVSALRDDLAAAGVVSKVTTSARGVSRGGVPLERGTLYHLLANRIYVGQIVHKDQVFPGQHAAIVDAELFEAVQSLLATQAVRKRATAATPSNPKLTGLIVDDVGQPMTPVSTFNGSQRYRYYASSALINSRKAEAGSLPRVAAGDIEDLVVDRGRRLGLAAGEGDAWPGLRRRLRQVRVGKHRVRMVWSLEDIDVPHRTLAATPLPPGDAIIFDGQSLILDSEITIKTRGGARVMVGPNGQPAIERQRMTDPALVKALIRGEQFKRMLLDGDAGSIADLAAASRARPSYVKRALRLAFLAPTIKRAILEGTTSAGLSLERLRDHGVPDLWSEQLAAIN